jgi:hypothetical protein
VRECLIKPNFGPGRAEFRQGSLPVSKRHTMTPRRKLKKPVKRVLAGLVLIVVFILAFPLIWGLFDPPDEISTGSTKVHRFRDLNEMHLRFARANGIAPVSGQKNLESEIRDLVRSDKLVKINDTKYYSVNRLSHSHPYLVPRAKKLLELIGERFQEKLKENNLDEYQFRITSLMRTQESQRLLSFSNRNAASRSAHIYGTTFDITYKSLSKRSFWGKKISRNGAAIRLLSEAIRELQQEKRLVVVTERKETCFHITVR